MAISGRPVISRETRRLLMTIVLAVTALWVLARIRFQERPAASTPVPNVLAQLRPASSYADLARLIADIRPLVTAAVSASPGGAPALRIREGAAVTLRPGPADTRLAMDRATGLTIVQYPHGEMPGLLPWAPRVLDYPRYLVAADLAGPHIALRPVFIGGLFPVTSARWLGEVWALPRATVMTPGTFVFTTESAFAGVTTIHDGHSAIVPAALLFSAVERLQKRRGEAGELGIAIQLLSPAIALASGAATGVVVSAVDPVGAAAGRLVPTEVIEAIDGEDMRSPDHWHARAGRVNAGDTLTLRVRDTKGVREVEITATPAIAASRPADNASLGLRLRIIPRVGSEVLSVQPRSRAARAEIRQGDVLTVAGGQPSPTPAQVARVFAALPDRGSLLVAIARGPEHHVAVIEK